MRQPETEFRWSVTGIGSLPHQSLAGALDFVFSHCPEVPFVPELPHHKQMLVEPLGEAGRFLLPLRDGMWRLEPRDLTKFLSALEGNTKAAAENAAAFVEVLREKRTPALRAVKSQVVGPVTLGLSIFIGDKRLADHVSEYILCCEALRRAVTGQVELLREAQCEVLMFFDEPSLHGQSHETLPGPALAMLQAGLQVMEHAGVLTGIHCCGKIGGDVLKEFSPFVWSLAFEESGVNLKDGKIIDALQAHVASGRAVAFGLSDPGNARVKEILSVVRAPKYSFLTPPCGLAFSSEEEAASSMNVLQTVSVSLRHEEQ